ncbi:MAG: hypothetical protein HY905_16655 [Deltaproteobacteria bacterium]|nr:hypothetical protein [Deltaproteobacteria bacterium]
MRSIATAALVVAVLVSVGLWGCQDDRSPDPGGVGMQIRYITDEGAAAGVPEAIYDGVLRVCVAPTLSSCDDPGVFSTYFQVGNPTSGTGLFAPGEDIDEDGRPEKSIEGLPMDTTLKLVVTAHPAIGAPATWSCRADGIRLAKGERRFLTCTLAPIGQFSALDATVTQAPETFTGRFGHTVTALPDGRVLIAGGFDTSAPVPLADCQTAVAPLTLAAGTVCFRLIASKKAFVLEPGSGRIYGLASDLGVTYGRAFHSAVALPDGRVVLSGGIDSAILYFEPLAGGGYFPGFVPRPADAGLTGFVPTFEIFNPQLNALADNPNRDGNPERGGLEGSGNLAVPRAFATAALWPQDAGAAFPRVVVLGGLDPAAVTTRPSLSWEAWNDGGSGAFAVGAGSFARGRTMAGLGYMLYGSTPELWLIGGVAGATNDTELITIWQSTATGGVISSASPLPIGTAHAGKNFVMPCVTPVGNVVNPVAHLVTGSIGPWCVYDGAAVPPTYTPTYDLSTGEVRRCPAASIPPYVVNKAVAGVPLSTIGGWNAAADNPHVFGGCASLPDGSALVVGGANDFGFVATRGSHRVTWAGTAATKDGAMPATAYPTAALLPSAATTVGGDAIFVGGLSVTLTGAPAVTFLDDVVVYNYAD